MGSGGVRGACHSVQGGSGGLAPGLGHGVQRGVPGGLLPRFRPRRTKGGPGGLAPRFRPQRLELTHFVTGSVMFFVVFHAFHNLYTPPKTPFFPPTGPASLLVVIRGFPPPGYNFKAVLYSHTFESPISLSRPKHIEFCTASFLTK